MPAPGERSELRGHRQQIGISVDANCAPFLSVNHYDLYRGICNNLAAHNPPNPAPTITTRGGVVSERAIDGMAPDMTGHYIDIASVIFN